MNTRKSLRDFYIPNKSEFLKGVREFNKHESRDAMYRVATYLVENFWGNPTEMANGMGVLLLTWNHASYRYGSFDYNNLENCLKKHSRVLDDFRNMDIKVLDKHKNIILTIFRDFNDALSVYEGRRKVKNSPVATSKALHLLCPKFFPLWDNKIANAYGCFYTNSPSTKYFKFCEIMRYMASKIKTYNIPNKKSILKLIDEYNYSKYTKGWI